MKSLYHLDNLQIGILYFIINNLLFNFIWLNVWNASSAIDGCSFDFEFDADKQLLDKLDWEEYSNPLEEEGISSEFDSSLSSPTEWVKDWDNRVDWYSWTERFFFIFFLVSI